jgi:hypothetical protein
VKVFQQLSASCSCTVCKAGCLCGDCKACSNSSLDSSILTNAKRLSALAVLAVVLGGFVYFAPVVTLGATPTVTETISMRVQQSGSNGTLPMGSISFCLFGDGAVLINGTYYPAVSLNLTQSQVCNRG